MRIETGSKVVGYDDPRMPTLVGLRRRGYTKEAIRNFITDAGLSRTNITVESSMLEYYIREDLKLKTNRLMAIKKPLLLVIDNYPEGEIEYVDAMNNSENEELGSRKVAFGKRLYIEQDDFVLEKPNKHYKRLALGIEVRLYHAYFVKAESVVYDEDGNIKVYASIYEPNEDGTINENTTLIPIETDKEWEIIQTILTELQKDATEEGK